MGLSDVGSKLPPGFRFHPNDEELVCHYLFNKIRAKGEDALKGTDLVEIDLHTCEPWQLPDVAKLNAHEWYFFSFRDRKYATGFRTNRATTSGYWKATGKDRTVIDPRTKKIVGMRKTLVFYRNRAPNGIKTGWIMHEFRLETPNMPPKEDWVLCRVFNKSKSQDNNINTINTKLPFDQHDTTFVPNYPTNYINTTPPTSSSSPRSSNIDHHLIKIPCGSGDPLITSLSSPSNPLYYPHNEVSYHGNSLLAHLYQKSSADQTGEINSRDAIGGDHKDDHEYDNFFWDVTLAGKGSMGDDVVTNLEDDMKFELLDNTMVFQ